MKKKIFLLSAMLFVLCFASACGSKEKTPQVNIGYFNNITHAQALFLKAEGTLEKSYGEQTAVNWHSFNAGPAEVEALFSGDLDICYIGPVPALNANVRSRADMLILSGATKGGAVLLRKAGAEITSAADLEGKTVAVPQIGNTQHLSLLRILSENGLKPESEGGNVRVTAVSNADVGNMLERGDIDAALVPEPWGSTLLERGAELVLDYDELHNDGEYSVAVVVVRKDFLKEHPDMVETFLQAHTQATEVMNKDLSASLEIINQELQQATGKNLTKEILEESFQRITISTEIQKPSIQEFAEISQKQGLIPELPNEDELYVE